MIRAVHRVGGWTGHLKTPKHARASGPLGSRRLQASCSLPSFLFLRFGLALSVKRMMIWIWLSFSYVHPVGNPSPAPTPPHTQAQARRAFVNLPKMTFNRPLLLPPISSSPTNTHTHTDTCRYQQQGAPRRHIRFVCDRGRALAYNLQKVEPSVRKFITTLAEDRLTLSSLVTRSPQQHGAAVTTSPNPTPCNVICVMWREALVSKYVCVSDRL